MINRSPNVTIIIPVYKVEATLDRCVRSVVEQSYHDLEVVLVDDGSPDQCPQLCDQWAERDERVRVIHKKNGGLSDARNAGIEAAKGEWVMFVDSDDELGKDTLAQVMAMTEGNDMVEFPVYRFYGSERQELLTFRPQVYEDMKAYWLEGRAYEHAYAWNKIYRKELFDEVRFPKGEVFEDMHTLPRLLLKAHRVATTDQGIYYYHWNHRGITATADGTALTSLLKAHLKVGWMDDRLYLRMLNIQIDVYARTGALLLPHRTIGSTAGLPAKARVKAFLLKLLGVKGVCKFFSFIAANHNKSE